MRIGKLRNAMKVRESVHSSAHARIHTHSNSYMLHKCEIEWRMRDEHIESERERENERDTWKLDDKDRSEMVE